MVQNQKTGSTARRLGMSSVVPVVLRPKVMTLKNRIFGKSGVRFSDIFAVILTIGLMAGLYLCCTHTVEEWIKLSQDRQVSPSLLSGALGALFGLIFLSAAVSALSSLFTGRDIDRFLASPLSPVSFLWGKTCEVGISTVWMLIVFFIPLYTALGVSLKAGYIYFLLAPMVLAAFLLVAVLCGVLVAVVFASLIPAHIGRNVFVVLFVLTLGFLLGSLRILPSQGTKVPLPPDGLSPQFGHIIASTWMPSYWIARAIHNLLSGDIIGPVLTLVGCSLGALAVWVLLVWVFRRTHQTTYSRLQTQRTPLRKGPPTRRLLWLRRGLGRNRRIRALVTREFFSFTRDITHTVQLGMLLAICLLYLYSLQNIDAPTHVGTLTLQAWDLCAIFSSLILSSIIILSICARFVFPSVSLEGPALWILQTAPMKSRDILRAKHLCWFFPTALMSAVIFSSGGLALGLEPLLILALVGTGMALAYGLVALGVGIGARFARFDWEHPTELSTSWGSLVYTLCGMGVVALTLLPATIMFGLYIFFPVTFQNENRLLGLLAAGLGSLIALNLILGKVMLKVGISALENLRE